MTTFWKMVTKFPCIALFILLVFLTMTARVQGDIATLTERTLINFISGIAVISIVLYSFLYITGSLNPGDKAIIDFKKIGEKLLKGNAND
jgi:heme/copper-type cytochrome/quinol oxidase subunit 4